MELSLECLDCHLVIKGERYDTLERMERHTRAEHNRGLIFRRDFYTRDAGRWTSNELLASLTLLRPEFIVCA